MDLVVFVHEKMNFEEFLLSKYIEKCVKMFGERACLNVKGVQLCEIYSRYSNVFVEYAFYFTSQVANIYIS